MQSQSSSNFPSFDSQCSVENCHGGQQQQTQQCEACQRVTIQLNDERTQAVVF